ARSAIRPPCTMRETVDRVPISVAMAAASCDAAVGWCAMRRIASSELATRMIPAVRVEGSGFVVIGRSLGIGIAGQPRLDCAEPSNDTDRDGGQPARVVRFPPADEEPAR